MIRNIKFIMILLVTVTLFGSGCKSRTPLLEVSFSSITVGKTTTSQVLNMLPESSLQTTDHSISAFSKEAGVEEAGLVLFDQDASVVNAKWYVLHTSSLEQPFKQREKMVFRTQFEVPAEVLETPYKNQMRKSVAILQASLASVIETSRPFTEDADFYSLVGLVRSAISGGVLQVQQHPRRASDLYSVSGFHFTHPNLEKSRLFIRQESDTIYSVTTSATALVDSVSVW